MQILNDYDRMAVLLQMHPILVHLKERNIPMKLISYDSGETIVSNLEKTRFIQFIVSGMTHIYGIRYDGSQYTVSVSDRFTVIGDVEIVDEWLPSFIVDAISPVLCIAIPINETKKQLLEDNVFLRFLLQTLAGKLSFVAEKDVLFPTIEEKLMHYIKFECQNLMITSIEYTRLYLKCSRRQLHRVIKQFVEAGTLEKLGRGKYRLTDNNY